MRDALFFCHRCRHKVPQREIRYSKDGTQHLCVNCFNNHPVGGPVPAEPKKWVATDEDIALIDVPADEPGVAGLAASKRVTKVHGKSVEQAKPGRVKFLCVQCRYSFAINRNSRLAHKCPNCGAGNPLEVTEINVQELLDE